MILLSGKVKAIFYIYFWKMDHEKRVGEGNRVTPLLSKNSKSMSENIIHNIHYVRILIPGTSLTYKSREIYASTMYRLRSICKIQSLRLLWNVVKVYRNRGRKFARFTRGGGGVFVFTELRLQGNHNIVKQ